MRKTRIKRGSIYFVKKSIAIGSEMMGGRPAIIVSNDEGNKASDIVEVVYLTSERKKELPTHAEINSAVKPSTAICEQITTVSKQRLGLYVGRLTEAEMTAVEKAIKISLGLQ